MVASEEVVADADGRADIPEAGAISLWVVAADVMRELEEPTVTIE